MVRPYIDIIKNALTQIAPEFFRIPTTYSPEGIVRERVFCYELYHQLRINIVNERFMSIHGEIDKRGHRDFTSEDQRNPDFVFHIPGTHESNTLVVEVKGSLNSIDGMVKDFNTLLSFVSNYGYAAGIFILYNHTIEELLSRIGDVLVDMRKSPISSQIHLLIIDRPNSECSELTLDQIHVVT